jgi:hypothetical protein
MTIDKIKERLLKKRDDYLFEDRKTLYHEWCMGYVRALSDAWIINIHDYKPLLDYITEIATGE